MGLTLNRDLFISNYVMIVYYLQIQVYITSGFIWIETKKGLRSKNPKDTNMGDQSCPCLLHKILKRGLKITYIVDICFFLLDPFWRN